jgi:hypothetical protein
MICAYFSYFTMPEVLNKNVAEERKASLSFFKELVGQNDKSSNVTYKSILTNLRAFIAICSCVFGSVFLMFNEPIISDQLIKVGVSEHVVGIDK